MDEEDPSPDVAWGTADVAIEKFAGYSMDPDHPSSGGKWLAFAALGFSVREASDRLDAAREIVGQVLRSLPPRPRPIPGRNTGFGLRYETDHVIVGPNGQQGTLRAVWQVAPGTTTPRLVTNFLRVQKLPP